MKTIGYYMRKANYAIGEALEAERLYCVTLSKNKHVPTEESTKLLETANKTYKTAKRYVKNVYQMFEIDAPEMRGIYSTQLAMDAINRRYADFWESVQNNK